MRDPWVRKVDTGEWERGSLGVGASSRTMTPKTGVRKDGFDWRSYGIYRFLGQRQCLPDRQSYF